MGGNRGGGGGGGRGDCPNLSQSVHAGTGVGNWGGVACCRLYWQAQRLAGRTDWNDCLGGWWGWWWWVGVSAHHLCYDLHGCQSRWQQNKALAELEAGHSHSSPTVLQSQSASTSSLLRFYSKTCKTSPHMSIKSTKFPPGKQPSNYFLLFWVRSPSFGL